MRLSALSCENSETGSSLVSFTAAESSPSTSVTDSSSALSLPSAPGSSSESSSDPSSSILSSKSQRILLAALQEFNGKLDKTAEELAKIVDGRTIVDKKLDKLGDLAKNI